MFLEGVKGKAMRRWVESINKVIIRKVSDVDIDLQTITAFSLTWPAPMQVYSNKTKRLQEKKYDSQNICLGHQHGRHFIVLEHRLFTIYHSAHGVGKWFAKFRTSKFRPGIAFTICSNQFHLPKNGWYWYQRWLWRNGTRISVWNISFGKTGLPFQMFCCSQKFSGKSGWKARSPTFCVFPTGKFV